MVHEGYPSRLFNLRENLGELNDLIQKEPEKAAELLRILDNVVDRKAVFEIWNNWRKFSFEQFQRQAKNGLYIDSSYGLKDNPSSNYNDLLNNTFTGWSEEDEERVAKWLGKK